MPGLWQNGMFVVGDSYSFGSTAQNRCRGTFVDRAMCGLSGLKPGCICNSAMKQLLPFILLLIASSSLAQTDSCTHAIQGKIMDIDTKQPLAYVTVQVQGEQKSATTNLKGEFFVDGLCNAEPTLVISCFGYCDSICHHHYQQDDIPSIYLTKKVLDLETVTIEAQRIRENGTASLSQITLQKAELRSDPTKSLASAIAEEQGVTFISTGNNVQLPVIHGLYGNRILVLNNGLKHGFQNWGTDHAPELDVSAANQITILKGASGVRFGPEALGGSVIVSPNPLYLQEPLTVEVGTGYQTNGRGVNSRIELAQGLKKWSYFLNANFTKIGDRHTPDYVLTNSGKEERSFGVGTRYFSGNWDFKFYYSYVNQDLALLRSSFAHSGDAIVQAFNADEPLFIRPFSYQIQEPNQIAEHHFGKAEVSWTNEGIGKLTFRAGRQVNNRQEFDVRRNADLPIIDLNLETEDYQLEWKHPHWLHFDGLIGVQYFYQDNDNNPGTNTTPFIPNYNTDRYSAFLIESRRIGKNTLEVGIRLDHEANSARGRETNQAIFRDEFQFTNLTSSVGFIRELSEHSTFRTNLGTAWRAPNMAELYSFGQLRFMSQFGLLRHYVNEEGTLKTNRVIQFSESGVEPEKGYKFINEFQHHKGLNRHTLTAYSHYIQNFIFSRPYTVIGTIRGPMPVFIFDQADAFFVGADYNWTRDWTERHTGTFGISYLWSGNISKNETLINQPPIAVNYKWEWDMGKLLGLSSRMVVKPRYTFTQFQAPRTIPPEDLIDGTVEITKDAEIFDFKDAPEGYFMLDASWRFEWKALSGSIAVHNLLNARYRDYLNQMRYFADEPGRNVLFNLTYRFNAKNKV